MKKLLLVVVLFVSTVLAAQLPTGTISGQVLSREGTPAVDFHFAAYNFVKQHRSIGMTPAMAIGIENDFWSYADLLERAE